MITQILQATKGRRVWFAKALLLDLLAAVWRRCMWRTTFIAITGSFGKSTANECLGAALGARWPVVKTSRNRNGFDNICWVIFAVRPWHRFAVLEVGAERKGMLRHWARVIRPDIVVMVNVGGAHSLSFPTLDDVAEEKSQLLKGLKRGGLAVLNGDNPRVAAMASAVRERGCNVAFFGSNPSFEVSGEIAKSHWPDRFSCKVRQAQRLTECETQFVGPLWLPSVLAALTVAARVGVPIEEACTAISKTPPIRARLQPVLLPNGAVILRDDTNSFFDAFKASLAVLKEARCERRIFVSDGFTESSLHARKRAVELGGLAGASADVVVFFGQTAKEACRAAVRHGITPENAHRFKTMREVADFLETELRKGDLVLAKGRFDSHLARISFAQVAEVGCWISRCNKPIPCDRCEELGVPQEVLDRYSPTTLFDQRILSPAKVDVS
jgi:UDP-N-acetylmuramoyl-tripeptide--D-alanyl-D-alanine ligase